MPSNTTQRGSQGEIAARRFLENLGWQFITANWRCKAGEIDLIMQDGDTRVFVEVRLRRPTSYGVGSDTVAWQKQQKLRKTAAWYMQAENYWGNTRFDVVSIESGSSNGEAIEYIPAAFE